MASLRAFTALKLRRRGATYPEIADDLGVCVGRARDLVMHALAAEARESGERYPMQAAYDSIRFRRRRGIG